ncbi:TIGR01906 family membrane protein [Streptococcus suis]|uniref:TIGR01906 family membrane protein n=1 Tax=Streptococcus TaxID=1301 RepID=UPI0014328038|nr:TIGR01906 family membrane protein [Streptococcus suis]
MKTKVQVIGSIFFILASAVLATIYLAWIFYPLEIEWLGLEKIVYMKATDISYNLNALLDYLTNPFQQVLDMPNFRSSAAGLKHFRDVKYLFHFAQFAFLISLPAFISFVKQVLNMGYGQIYRRVFTWVALAPVLIGLVGVLIGFDTFFVLFHKVLFPGDSTWLFDPAKDPVIYILPQDFFLHCFILFFVLYELFSLAMLAWTVKSTRKTSRENFSDLS